MNTARHFNSPIQSILAGNAGPSPIPFPRQLSGPHRLFAEGIASGLDQCAAYIAAYPGSKPASARANACRLIANDSVRAEVAALRAAAQEQVGGVPLTLARKLEFLAGVVRDTAQKTSDRLRALELHAKLSGELTDKVQVSADEDLRASLAALVDSIRK
ncbi:MAG: Terminase small subunit [Verrucomicrobiales bacterium]|nr:Terminase small subunit [Verrucomicrobiales bacterium]